MKTGSSGRRPGAEIVARGQGVGIGAGLDGSAIEKPMITSRAFRNLRASRSALHSRRASSS